MKRFVIGLGVLGLAGGAMAKTATMEDWFVSSLKGKKTAFEDVEVKLDEVEKLRGEVFEAYGKAAEKNGWKKKFLAPTALDAPQDGGQKKVELRSGKYKIGKGLEMPYLVVVRGKKPEGGWPLAIAMHGGGGTGDKLKHPHAWPVNSREWRAQLNLSARVYPEGMIYFIPRMVDDNQGRCGRSSTWRRLRR